jgi:hypothetical protein
MSESNIDLGRAVFDIMDKLKDERDFAIAEVERLEAIVKNADAAHAEAFRAGRIAQAEEDAKIASATERPANAKSKEVWWDVALEIATAIRANAAKLANESAPPSSARAERGE